ncbi:UDP-3-O-acyl-N-acetylglucosamine deacetylase [Deferribacterales bacterium RsTz2092]|nr:UDP-3-O-acyl-N-acetylglucosamine deacetylase [Deferribacterales bacterium]
MYQTTLAENFAFSGVGLHNGKDVRVHVLPAVADTGVQFRRVDVQNCPYVRITPFNVSSTQLATTVQCADFPISTIEHVMSALYGLGVDNAYIDVEGAEIPILDGSALPVVEYIRKVGVIAMESKRKYMILLEPLELEHESKFISSVPTNELKITFDIDYPHSAIGKQSRTFVLTPDSYADSVANARTFGFASEIEVLRRMGLTRGGSLDNAIVVDDKAGILNLEGLRSQDEFVSHKILDLIGDLSLIGHRIVGHISAVRSGHQVNNMFARKLVESSSYYKITELDGVTYGGYKGYGYIK